MLEVRCASRILPFSPSKKRGLMKNAHGSEQGRKKNSNAHL